MTPLGNNIKVKPIPNDKVLPSGLIIPDTATPKALQWGECLEGNDYCATGSKLLFFRKKCFTIGKGDNEEMLVPNSKIIYHGD